MFGGVGGIASLLAAGVVRRTMRQVFHRTWFRTVKEAVSEFEDALRHDMETKIARKREKIEQMESEIERVRRESDRRADETGAAANLKLTQRLVRPWRRIWNWLAAFFARTKREPLGLPVECHEIPNEVIAHWMRLKFEDQILCVAECQAEMNSLPKDPFHRVRELMRLMRESGVHPLSVNKEFTALCSILRKRQGLSFEADLAER